MVDIAPLTTQESVYKSLENSVVTTTPNLPQDVVEQRAAKYDFALGEKSPGPLEIRDRIYSDLEQADRQRYALEKQVELSTFKNQMIQGTVDNAASQGRDLTPEESQLVQDLSLTDMETFKQDPQTFMEREFAKRVISTSVDSTDLTEDDFAKMDLTESLIAAKESYQKLAEETYAEVKNQSWAGYLADSGKGLFPFYMWYKLHNVLTQEKGGSFLAGDNLAEQVRAAYSEPIETTLPKVKATIAQLKRDNPQLAMMFANALVEYSSTDANIDNLLISGIDMATFLPVGTAVKGAKSLAVGADLAKGVATNVDSTLRGVLKEVLKKNASTAEVLDAAGDVQASSVVSVFDKIKERMNSGGLSDTSFKALINEMQGSMNPMEILGGPRSSHSVKFTQELLDEMTNFSESALSKLFLDPLKTGRFGPQAVEAATIEADKVFRIERRDLENAILNTFEDTVDAGLGNHSLIVHIGTTDGKLFESADQARNTAKLYGFREYSLAPAGKGFAIQLERPLDFSTPIARKAMVIDAQNAPTPLSNTIGQLLLNYRTGEEVLPTSVSEKFKNATYGASGMEKMVMSRAKTVGKIKNPKDFHAFIKYQQQLPNPTNPDKLGKFSNTLGEFEVEWQGRFNRLPTEQETKAYFAYKQISDLQYAGLNLNIWLEKNSIGLTSNRFPGMEVGIEGKISNVDAFSGPNIKENATVLLMEEGAEPKVIQSRYTPKGEDGKTDIDHIRYLTGEKGYVVTQLSKVGARQFSDILPEGLNKNVFDFVVTKEVRSEPLGLNQIPYQPGGHHIMPDGWYISQPNLSSRNGVTKYYGDTNIFFGASEKVAREAAANMEKARQIYLKLRATPKASPEFNKTLAEFKQFVKANTPVTPSQLLKDFGRKGRLDASSPILARPSNSSLDAVHKLDKVYEGTEYIREKDSIYNLYRGRVNLEYAMDRGDAIYEVVKPGHPNAPLFEGRPSSVIDPIAALNRSLSTLTRGRHFEPLKLEVAERFNAEFGDLLAAPTKEIDRDPIIAMVQGHFKTGLKGDDLVRQKQAEAFRARAVQFLGLINKDQQQMQWVASKLLGDNPAAADGWRKSLAEILTEKNPIDMARGLTYHAKMGIWNVKQLFQQANTWVNVQAMAGPVIGTKAGLIAMAQNWVMMNPEVLKGLGGKAIASLGFSEREFIEATEALARTGYGNMGREVATREQHMYGKAVQTQMGMVMDHGLYFMRKGEEFVRRTSWNAAYLEWLAKNKGKSPTDFDIQKILNRADFLNVNMSHASNASWQQGIQAIPTQFWAYQVRLMEQFTGKRLSNAEKARALATYSMYYGIPISATAAVGVWPVQQSVKEWLINHNVDPNENTVGELVNGGLFSWALRGILGEDTNVEEVYGPSGITLLKDIYDGDKSLYEMLSGASGSFIFDTAMSVAPVLYWSYSALNPDKEAVPVSLQDFNDVFRNIGSFSYAQRAWIAATTGAYLTKNSQIIKKGDSNLESFFITTLGLQPQDVSDMYAKMKVDKDYDEYKLKLSESIKRDIRNMYQSDNYEDRLFWHNRAKVKSVWIDDPIYLNNIWARTSREYKTLLEKANERHAKRSPEAREYERRLLEKGKNN